MEINFSGGGLEDDSLLSAEEDDDAGSVRSDETIMSMTEVSKGWLRVNVAATSMAVGFCGASLISFVVVAAGDEDDESVAIDLCVVSGSMLVATALFSVVGAISSLAWALTLSCWLLLPSWVCQALAAIFLAQFLAHDDKYASRLAVLALILTLLVDAARHRATLALRRSLFIAERDFDRRRRRRNRSVARDYDKEEFKEGSYQGGGDDEYLISL